MNLVIDTNRLIAGLLKSSLCREIILHEALTFYAPDYVVTEIEKYRSYICKKAEMEEKTFNVVLYILLENIRLVPHDQFGRFLSEAIEIMRHIDIKDAPFIAVSMALNVDGIWTEDKHFYKQTAIKVYSIKELGDILCSQRWQERT
jgi:predicted nucleic acid-binding protein